MLRSRLKTIRCRPKFRRVVLNKAFHTGHTFPRLAQTKVNICGVNINIEQVGQGPHPVLCLPGALGFIESDFGPILPSFNPSKYSLIAWDPPGYGKSRPPDRDFSEGAEFYHRDAAYAEKLMKNLGYSKFSMLGWSDGANTACILVAKYPVSVNKLVIWGGNAYITDDDMKLYNQVKNIDNWSERMKAPMIKMYGESYFREKWTEWIEAFDTVHKSGGDLFKEILPKIDRPTFILHGMKDAMVPVEHPMYLQEHIRNSRLHIFQDGKHNLHFKYAEDFVKMVEEFLDE